MAFVSKSIVENIMVTAPEVGQANHYIQHIRHQFHQQVPCGADVVRAAEAMCLLSVLLLLKLITKSCYLFKKKKKKGNFFYEKKRDFSYQGSSSSSI